MTLQIVAKEELEHVWPKVRDWITAALEYGQGDENEFDVLSRLSSGEYLLFWAADRYAGVVQVQEHPRQKVAVIVYAGGSDPKAMKEEIEACKPWCRHYGITQIRIFGRPGWERVLNFARKGVIMQEQV
jgi:hypothetical protein